MPRVPLAHHRPAPRCCLAMCAVCHHPDRIAIEAALQAGRPLRSLAADYPGLNKSTLGRHRKEHMAGASVTAPAPSVAPQETPTLPAVRRRTRPIDEAQRLDIALRMKARGSTRADIARALNVHPSTVGEIMRRATENAVERVRTQTVEELVTEHRAERHARVQALHALLSDATLRNDARTSLDVLRELRHEAKEDREWMRELGGFDRYRLTTEARAQASRSQADDDLISMFKELVTSLAPPNAEEGPSLTPTGTTH